MSAVQELEQAIDADRRRDGQDVFVACSAADGLSATQLDMSAGSAQ